MSWDYPSTPTIGRSDIDGSFWIEVEEKFRGRKVNKEIFFYDTWQELATFVGSMLHEYEKAYRTYVEPEE